MIGFLFWNLDQQPLQDAVARLAWAYDIDVVILAECAVDPPLVVQALSKGGRGSYHLRGSGERKIKVFTRLPASCLEERRDFFFAGLDVRALRIGRAPEVLLAMAHLPGKPGWTDRSQEEAAGELARMIEKIEKELGTERTVLVGDLNLDPFEPGLTSAYKLHAVMSRKLALPGARIVQKRKCRFFYNPMWSCFGDRTPGPPGTYFIRQAAPVMQFWHILDQVLLRPSIMHTLSDVRILDSLDNDGTTSLLDKGGLPCLSDHLPILFRLDLS